MMPSVRFDTCPRSAEARRSARLRRFSDGSVDDRLEEESAVDDEAESEAEAGSDESECAEPEAEESVADDRPSSSEDMWGDGGERNYT